MKPPSSPALIHKVPPQKKTHRPILADRGATPVETPERAAVGLPDELDLNMALEAKVARGIKRGWKWPRNDDERAARFALQFKDELLYVPQWKRWMSWNDQKRRWLPDGENECVTEMVSIFVVEADRTEDSDLREKLHKLALSWGSDRNIKAMLNRARHRMACKPAQFDADSMLLGVENGTVDLKTGKFRGGRRDDYLSKCANVVYEPNATCPLWEQFLSRIFSGNDELIDLVWRAVGYSLTGLTNEQVIFFAYGVGQNGKSTFFEVLLCLLGDYAQKTKSELFTENRWSKEPETLIARLMGTRFVVGAEMQAGARLNAALIKDLCGGDVLTGRQLYKNHVNFTPTHKIWGYGNYCPTVHDTDHGIWRRIRLIPFEVEIPANERDPLLSEKLKAELPGILNWAIAGCNAWRRGGLGTAVAVTAATAEYRDEEDEVGEFIGERCIYEGRITRCDLYAKFRDWAEFDQGTPANRIISKKLFATRVRGRPGITDYKPKIEGQRAWDGISLKTVMAD